MRGETLGKTRGEMLGKPLTPRELEVCWLAAKGLRNQDIAEAMKLTEGSAKEYMLRVFRKLGVASRVGLAVRVLAGCPECNGQRVRVYPETAIGQTETCRRCDGRGFA